jgi:thiamine pyrophosphokinase
MSECSTAERAHSATVEWQPADLIRRRGQPLDEGKGNDESGFALVVLNQPLHAHLGVVRRIWNNGVYFPLTLTNKIHNKT